MKRRLYVNDDGDEDPSSDLSSSTFSASSRKRVRYNSLERTMAHMTLGTALANTSEDVDMWPWTSPRVQETLDVVLPSSVEEPDSRVVDMEVEPTYAGQLDIKEVQISSAVLECLRRQTKCPPPLVPLSSQTSQALVLYRPPRPPSPKPLEQILDDRAGKSTQTSILVAHEDDVMEIG